jgi:hypothetical protein
MQLQMNERYDRRPHQQQQNDHNLERVATQTLEFHYPTDIQERQHQQRAWVSRDGISKPETRRMSTANTSNNTDSAIGAPVSATLPTLSRQDRDDSRPQQYPSPSSPHATSATSSPIPTPSPRNGRAGYQLSLPIPQLQRSEWVNLEGLVECALSSLGKDECTGISELGKLCDTLITYSSRSCFDHILYRSSHVPNRAFRCCCSAEGSILPLRKADCAWGCGGGRVGDGMGSRGGNGRWFWVIPSRRERMFQALTAQRAADQRREYVPNLTYLHILSTYISPFPLPIEAAFVWETEGVAVETKPETTIWTGFRRSHPRLTVVSCFLVLCPEQLCTFSGSFSSLCLSPCIRKCICIVLFSIFAVFCSTFCLFDYKFVHRKFSKKISYFTHAHPVADFLT